MNMGTEKGLTELSIMMTLEDNIKKGIESTFNVRESTFLFNAMNDYWKYLSGTRAFPINDLEEKYIQNLETYHWLIRRYDALKSVLREAIKPEFLPEEYKGEVDRAEEL